jgi:hypothetical protein
MPRSRAFFNEIEVRLDMHGFQVLESDQEESSSSLPAMRKRRNDEHADNEHAETLSTKRSRTTSTPKQYTQPPAVTQEKDDSLQNKDQAAMLQNLRQQQILGCRIARTLAPLSTTTTTTNNHHHAAAAAPANTHPYCYGRVISVQKPGDNHHDLDQDLYRVSYEDGGVEDLNTLTLFGTYCIVLCRFSFLVSVF